MVIPRLLVRTTNLVNKSFLSHVNRANTREVFRLISTSRHLAAERRFTDKHEWVEVNGKVAVVGISQYAQEALGDVVYAQLPDVSTDLSRGDECGALESVKAASEIYSPISGKVIEINKEVEETPSIINTSCYEKGWLFKLELKEEAEIKELMTEEKYNEFLKSDHH